MRRRVFTLSFVLLLIIASAASAQTQRGLENCTTDGTSEDLVTGGPHHTTDSGSWTELFDLQSDNSTNGAQTINAQGSGGNANRCIPDPGGSSRSIVYTMTVGSALPDADYDVIATIPTIPSGQTDGDYFCLALRVTDSTHGMYMCVTAATNARGWGFYVSNGTHMNLTALSLTTGSSTFSPTAGDIWKFTARGNTYRFYGGASGTTEIGCAVDSTISATGKPGIGFGGIGADASGLADVSNGWTFDAYTVQSGGSGTDDDCGGGAAGTAAKDILLLRGN